VEGPEDIWSRVCVPHVREPPAAFSRELPGMAMDTLPPLTEGPGERPPRSREPHLILGKLKALLGELFRGFGTLC